MIKPVLNPFAKKEQEIAFKMGFKSETVLDCPSTENRVFTAYIRMDSASL
jgi:hypothetical protein